MNITNEFHPKTELFGSCYLGIPEVITHSVTDNVLKAWLVSKPNIKYNTEEEAANEVNKLISNNLPISGFKVYCFTMYSSIYFRDLLFCMPNVVPWSQSTRNLEFTSDIYQISSEIANTDEAVIAVKRLAECRRRSSEGEALDLVKKDLPKSTMMQYSFFIDRRTLLTFVKTIQVLDPLLYKEYGTLLLDAAGITPEDYVSMKIAPILDKLMVTDEELSRIKSKKSVVIPLLDAYKLHIVNMDFGIAAQFIRQHFSHRRYYEFNRIRKIGYLDAIKGTLRDKTIVSVMGDAQSFDRTISRRLCYFAAWDKSDPNDDSWALILDDYVKNTTDEQFDALLPCKGCADKCDIIDEFKLRLLKAGDPNLKSGLTAADRNGICPYLLDKLGVSKSPKEVLEERASTQGSNSLTYERWLERFGGSEDEFDQLLNEFL